MPKSQKPECVAPDAAPSLRIAQPVKLTHGQQRKKKGNFKKSCRRELRKCLRNIENPFGQS